ncbi:DUF937 domain-containing protein [Phormidium tenue FACHB-886]|nr:DUF937 domain-containing protein [Phormidium tenue FACHB-886]
MGLFDQIVGAIANPNQQANPDQLSQMLNTVNQAAGSQGVPPAATNDVMSMLGGYVRSSLQQKAATNGRGSVETLVNQFGGTNPSTAALQALFTPTQQQQVAQAISQRTGISASAIVAMLPILVPIVLNFLKAGSQNQSYSTPQSTNSNPVLSSFLDADGDGDVDIGDAMSMAGRYLSQR